MAGFKVQIFENSSLEVSEKSEIVATQAPVLGQTKGRKVRIILSELFDTWIWQPNDRKWFWLDGIESSCVGVEGSSKSICVRRFSPSPLSLFRFHLSPFPQKRLILRLLFLNRPKPAVDDAFVFGLPPHPKGQISANPMNQHCSLVIGQSYYEYCA